MTKVAVVSVAVAGLAFGQDRIGPVGHGFGSVVFPGTGIPQTQPGHAQNLGATIRGVYPVQPDGPRQHGGSPAIAVPYPVLVGGYGYGFGYGGYAPQVPQQQMPNITVVNTPQASPSVIINQNYTPDRAQPAMHEYPEGSAELGVYQAPVPAHPAPPARSAPAASDDDSPTIYLIALNDGTVYPAYAYWLEADTLHYITTKHSHNRTSLALVDEPLSSQLNRERRVAFKLKAK